ncbi:MAG: hypothetical protein MJE66_17350 [Proteobacteria bacterium]|nr:hypothetical protein [Pseudomonadota bacterium]
MMNVVSDVVRRLRGIACGAGLVVLAVAGATTVAAYPGGTPSFQTDVAPFCAGCHSSVKAEHLAGVGERATKELAENKHYANIRAGKGGYEELSADEREKLIEHLRAVDANTKLEMETPPQVEAGKTFEITLRFTGGAGPVVAIALVDQAHRWFAKPASTLGWRVVGPPTIIGNDGQRQTQWLERRPESQGRELTYVNVTGHASDVTSGEWGSAKIVYTLRAPEKPGAYDLVAAFFYGTEKATPLGHKVDPVRGKQVRGSFLGNSGRVDFTPVRTINVQ